MPLVEARARELEERAEQSALAKARARPKAPVEEASTAASDAGVTEASVPSAALPVEEEQPEEVAVEEEQPEEVAPAEEEVVVVGSESAEGAVGESPALADPAAKRRRAIVKKLRAIDALLARGNLTEEEEAKVQRCSDLERELAELE